MVSLPSNDLSFASFNILVVSPTPTHPQDHGDSKRIFGICTELKRRGARIEFVHYAAERNWRGPWLRSREEEMRAAWDDYHLVAPSREAPSPARGNDCEIDEWTDPGLKGFVAWACRARAYDAVLVNFAWMSFCFDAVPKGLFKILDAHDAFRGRRLAKTNAVDPEFLHASTEKEVKALARADLVWAIKPLEAAYLRDEMQVTNCLTMLHPEPERAWWDGPPSQDGWLRAGIIGAKNGFNKYNLEEFLRKALPVIEAYMAPVKIIIAGGLSDEFESWPHPNVEVFGRVDDVAQFYAQIDVVVAPAKFNTGLKVSVSEALAFGAPLVAHVRAMEGFPSKEPLHRLHSSEDVAIELAQLSYDRGPLTALARRSQAVCRNIRSSVSNTLDQSQQRLVAAQASNLCFIVPTEAFDPSSILHEHFVAALEYLRRGSAVEIFARGPIPRTMFFDFFSKLDLTLRVFADPELVRTLGDRKPEFWTPISLNQFMEERRFSRLYLMADCADELLFSPNSLRQIFVRCDAIALIGGDVDQLVEKLRHIADLVLLTIDAARLIRWKETKGIGGVFSVPFRLPGAFESLKYRKDGLKPKPLLVLARRADPVAEELVQLAARLGWSGNIVALGDPKTNDILLGSNDTIIDPLARLNEVRLVVDVTCGDLIASILGEAAIRAGVPRLSLLYGQHALGRRAFPTPLKATSVAQLLNTVADCATVPHILSSLQQLTKDENDTKHRHESGWAMFWHYFDKGA